MTLDIESTTGANALTLDVHRHININGESSDTAGGAFRPVVAQFCLYGR